MRFSQDTAGHGYTIHTISDEGVTVHATETGSLLLKNSFIIRAEQLITDWEPSDIDQLHPSHLASIIEMEPEVVLLGTGTRLRFPPHALLSSIFEAGIGCEVMDSAAACRTYNVLNGEGRRVVAALLLTPTTAPRK